MRSTVRVLSILVVVVLTAHTETPKRIVSLAPNLTAMVTELGAAGSLVAVTPFCEASHDIRRVPGGMQPEAESVMALEPDLVLATSITPTAIIKRLRAIGIRTEVIKANSLQEIRDSLESLARILEIPGKAYPVRPVTTSKRTAALLFGADTGYSAGCGTHAHEILEAAGLQNIAASVPGPWPQLSEEFLLAADPEVIVVADYGKADRATILNNLLSHPVRKHLAAVKSGRIVVFPAGAFSIPGPAALEAGAKLHAEVEKL